VANQFVFQLCNTISSKSYAWLLLLDPRASVVYKSADYARVYSLSWLATYMGRVLMQVVAVGRTPDEAWADAAFKQLIAKVHLRSEPCSRSIFAAA